MRQIKEVLRLRNELELSVRQIARATGLARSTVSDYLVLARKAKLPWPLADDLDQTELWAKLEIHKSATDPSNVPKRVTPDWPHVRKELGRKNVTLLLLWQEYRQDHPEGYSRSQFFELYRQWAKTLSPVMRQPQIPGERLLVDWAGDKVPIRDPQTGEVIQASLFVCAFGASHKIYAEAFLDQKLGSWINGHVHALRFYGGVPRLIVPDNPKTAVTGHCRYEPKLHPSYLEMAEHYGTAILPARARKPRDKAGVETAVQIVQRSILGPLRDHTFFTLGALNQQIREILGQLNAKPYTLKEGTRDEVFESTDQPALKPLPACPYQLATWQKAKVNIDHHIVVDKRFYSVPYHLVHKEVQVRLSESSVEVYYQSKRIALHQRGLKIGVYSTVAEHRPKSHQKHQEWTPSRLIQWGGKVGSACSQLIEKILTTRPHPEQGYRSCLGLMRLDKEVGHERMEAACLRALHLQSYSYQSVKNILENKLDQLEEHPQLPLSSPNHENLRGPDYYQQSFTQN